MKNNIKFIGLGWAGCNLLSMPEAEPLNKLFIDTDKRVCSLNPFIFIGSNLLKGNGAGGGAALGRKAIDESINEIIKVIVGYKRVLIVAAMKGGTGGGAAYLANKLILSGFDVSLFWIKGVLIETLLPADDIRCKDLEKVQSNLYSLMLVSDSDASKPIDKSLDLVSYMHAFEHNLLHALLQLNWKAPSK